MPQDVLPIARSAFFILSLRRCGFPPQKPRFLQGALCRERKAVCASCRKGSIEGKTDSRLYENGAPFGTPLIQAKAVGSSFKDHVIIIPPPQKPRFLQGAQCRERKAVCASCRKGSIEGKTDSRLYENGAPCGTPLIQAIKLSGRHSRIMLLLSRRRKNRAFCKAHNAGAQSRLRVLSEGEY